MIISGKERGIDVSINDSIFQFVEMLDRKESIRRLGSRGKKVDSVTELDIEIEECLEWTGGPDIGVRILNVTDRATACFEKVHFSLGGRTKTTNERKRWRKRRHGKKKLVSGQGFVSRVSTQKNPLFLKV
jgi:hypothetical protein